MKKILFIICLSILFFANTSSAQVCPLLIQQAYKTSNSPSVFYITENCTKRAFIKVNIFYTYFDSWNNVKITSKPTLDSIPNDALGFMPYGPKYDPKYGALVKTVKDPKVYLLLGNEKYWISSEDVFNDLGYTWNWIEDIDQRLLDKYQTASEINYTNHHPNYTLIKYPNDSKVYRLEPDPSNPSNQIKKYIPNETEFKALGFRWDRILTIKDSESYTDTTKTNEVTEVKPIGCQYNNPACDSDFNCVNNQCIKKQGCIYSNPSCNSNYNCINNQCVYNPPVSQPIPAPTPPPSQLKPSITETLNYPSQFTLPNRSVMANDWNLTITPTIAYKDSQINFILTTESTKRGNVINATLSISQMPINGAGNTETLLFYNDATHGDQLSNDRYFTASTPARNWHQSVLLGTLNIDYRDETQETFNLIGEAFSALDSLADDISIYSSSHVSSLVQNNYKNIGQAFTHQAELCYSDLKNQIGDFYFPLDGRAYYIFYPSTAYLETGGPINIVRGSEQFLTSPAKPIDPEWNSCSPITSHELIHTIFYRVPKPVWADEGLAEYTSQAISGEKIICESNGWRKNSNDSLHTFINVNQDSWKTSQDSFMTSVCIYRYIEDNYGQQAIKKIYEAMKYRSSYENLIAGYHCGRNFNFYQDVLINATNQNFLNILQQHFGIKNILMQC